jgi:nitrogen regulatory protein PII
MTSKEIVINAMQQRGFNQTMLAEAAGLKRQTNVSEMLRSSSMRVDNFVKLLSAMGYEVIVKDKNPDNKIKWTVDNGEAK